MAEVPLSYQDVNITLFTTRTEVSLGYEALESCGLRWEETLHKVSGGSMVALTVVLAARYRLERCDQEDDCSYTKLKTIVVEADVQVDGYGEKVSNKPIRLHNLCINTCATIQTRIQ